MFRGGCLCIGYGIIVKVVGGGIGGLWGFRFRLFIIWNVLSL